MRPVDSILTALDSLRGNLLRTALTTLGIVIGVAAVIAMVGVSGGAERRVQAEIQSLGANILVVQNGTRLASGARGASGSAISLTEADARALEAEVPAVAIAAPSVRGSGQIVYGNTNWFTTILGAGDAYLRSRDWVIASGRTFSGADERAAAKVAILGRTVVDRLFEGRDPVGETIRVLRVPFSVVGVTEARGQTPWGTDQDDVIFVPLATAKKRVIGGDRVRGEHVHSITVKARGPELIAEAERETVEVLRRLHRIRAGAADDFTVRNVTQMLEARRASERTMGFLLACVASVALLVGGIGIMNIMLVSVTERTREIGLRMAVGATGRQILAQFVIEAVTLSWFGGLIGIGLGIAGSLLAARLAEWPIVISPQAILLAVAASAAVGIFFGYYPALKASRLDPIEALRRE
jgi:putative ABC transport system permease protein